MLARKAGCAAALLAQGNLLSVTAVLLTISELCLQQPYVGNALDGELLHHAIIIEYASYSHVCSPSAGYAAQRLAWHIPGNLSKGTAVGVGRRRWTTR
jgi:hypothetical protein